MTAREGKVLTERERVCLEFLDDKLYSSVSDVGRYVYDVVWPRQGSNVSAIGAALVGRLAKHGLVTKLSDIGLWRITPAGRAALKDEGGER